MFRLTKLSWDSVTKVTITNYFSKVGFSNLTNISDIDECHSELDVIIDQMCSYTDILAEVNLSSVGASAMVVASSHIKN